MRAVWISCLGVVMSLAFATGVATAAPGQNEWDNGIWNVPDPCTGDQIVGTYDVHFVNTASGPFHFNLHEEGVGQTTGARYEGQTVDNEFGHALPDGTFLFDRVIAVRIQAQGSLPNQIVFSLHYHLVVDADGNVISGFFNLSDGSCQGS